MKIVFLVLFVFCSFVSANEIDYELSRVIDAASGENVEVPFPQGGATVADSGPYTPIRHIAVDAEACSGLLASPPPDCERISLLIDAEAERYTGNGRVYFLSDGTSLTVVRRGSEATGDPSLILFVDGALFLFREIVERK